MEVLEKKIKSITIKGRKIDISKIDSPALQKIMGEIREVDGDLDIIKAKISNWQDSKWKQWRDGSGQKGCVMDCIAG